MNKLKSSRSCIYLLIIFIIFDLQTFFAFELRFNPYNSKLELAILLTDFRASY